MSHLPRHLRPDDLRDSLVRWLESAEHDWYDDADVPGHGWYGSGYTAWGVQTTQKHLAAAAVIGTDDTVSEQVREHQRARALAALRYNLASHHSGTRVCADGRSWGHTWISVLGIERMMFAVDRLDPWLTGEDRAALERVLISEADWLLTEMRRGDACGVVGARWNSTGHNVPESNLWNGALLWRTAARVPDHPDAERWRELAVRLLINSVSVSADAGDDTVVDGESVAARHVGANFFDSYALDHHGYLNVGYMVICASNAAMLHFDLRRRGERAPQSLHHHQADLWHAIRPMIGDDGRLLRIGGDSRVRYAYCQEYLLPSLLYAADHGGDPDADRLAAAQVAQLRAEQDANGDGSYYGRRLAALAARTPYYATRLESDRACAVAMTLSHLDLVDWPAEVPAGPVERDWVDHDHGAVLVRGPRRFASFAWRAYGLSQGLCVPPDRGDLAEWERNLAPEIAVEGVPDTRQQLTVPASRELRDHSITTFPGGFVTVGAVDEGARMTVAEGWKGGPAATSRIAVAALPDDRTVISFQLVRTAGHVAGIQSVKGIHLCVPNDVATGDVRRMHGADGELTVTGGDADEVVNLGRWTCVDDQLGVVALTGDEPLQLSRSRQRRGGALASMYVEEICLPLVAGHRYVRPGTTLVDVTCAVLSGTDAAGTGRFAADHTDAVISGLPADVRGVRVRTDDGSWIVVVNLGDDPTTVELGASGRCLPDGATTDRVELAPLTGTVLATA